MLRIIQLILLMILGYNTNNIRPVRSLHKKLSLKEKIDLWMYKHQYELLLLTIILMMILFVVVIFMVVPPMDAWNNHFDEVI